MDTVIATLLIVALGAASITLGRRLAFAKAAPWLALLVLLSTVGYVLFLSDRLLLVRSFPWSGLVFVALALPLPLVTLFLALIWPCLAGTTAVRLRLVVPLLLLTSWLSLGSFWGGPPETHSQPPDSGGVVRQTSESSCSAASAATLLASAKIPVTETEFAAVCLTRNAGTPMLGVYRGLRHKTDGTPWRVHVLSHTSIEQLQAATRSGPVLISVGLDRWQTGYDPRYITEWGWTPGKRHAVVVFGFLPDGKLDMGDPSVGREKWSVESLNVLWNGEGIQLLRK